jgi:hypothetical protein
MDNRRRAVSGSQPCSMSARRAIIPACPTDTALRLATVAAALLAIAVTVWIRWNGRRVRVRVEIREAWRPQSWPLAAIGGQVIEPPEARDVFDGSVVLINRGERSVWVERIGIELVDEPIYGYDFGLDQPAREVQPGAILPEKIDEETIEF